MTTSQITESTSCYQMGSLTKMPKTGIRLSKAQDHGLEFWHTKSFAIMTYATTPGDCIDRVTSHNGERVNFDRLETPRPETKVTLKKNWQSKQQQHSRRTQPLEKCGRKGALGWSTRRFDLLHRVESSHRKLGQTTSDMETDAFLKKEVITDTFSHAEAVKEEIAEKNTEVIESIKIGSNKICIRADLAKENMMFSQESSQAIFEMGNVELMELKNSRIQCPSCLHHVFHGTIICACGKFIKHNQQMTQRVRRALDILKRPTSVHLTRIQEVTSMDSTCGKSIITKRKMRCEEPQERTTKPTRIFWIDGSTMRSTGNPNKTLVGQTLLSDTLTTTRQISQSDLSTKYGRR